MISGRSGCRPDARRSAVVQRCGQGGGTGERSSWSFCIGGLRLSLLEVVVCNITRSGAVVMLLALV